MEGHALAHYRIIEKLGEGGMGVVYKAFDTHLDRFVALKILPPGKVADPDRLRRFIQEAKAASALNHPNIITVHDVQSAGDVHFIAMEYVAGKTLADLIGHKGLPLKELLRLAAQIAGALSAAHARGIVHRDLKPGNVMVTADGLVKVLDFGLAKLLDAVGDNVSTLTRSRLPETADGKIVGTPSYMSPEQAEGKPVDPRTDVFSFGSILYEMAAGRRAFAGGSAVATLSMLLNRDPTPLRSIAKGVPRDFERIVELCLKKDPNRRLNSMADVKLQLDLLREDSDSGALTPVEARKQKPARRWAAVAGALVAIAVVAAWLWPRFRPPQAPPEATLTRLTYDAGLTTDPALSPDGKLLAYASDRAGAGNLDIWVQQVGGGQPVQVTKDAADDREPSFSPDGTKIVFRSARDGGGIFLIPALGGAARKIASEGTRPLFSPGGESVAYYTGSTASAVLANQNSKLFVVNPDGGSPREIPTGFTGVCCPVWTPDGRHLLFLGNRDAALPLEKSLDWWVAPLDGGPAVKTGVLDITRTMGLRGPTTEGPWALIPAAWTPLGMGAIFSARSADSTNLWQVDLSPDSFKARGEARRLTSGTAFEWQPSVAARPGGGRRVVFASLTENSDIWSLPVSPDQVKVTGSPQRLTVNTAADFHPFVSADGSKLAFISNRGGLDQVWLKNLQTGEETALTSNPGEKYGPLFSPDASALTYSKSSAWGICLLRFAAGAEEVIRDATGLATSWSPDGRGIFFHDVPGRVSFLDLASHRSTLLLAKPDYRLIGTVVSPDGRWIAFSALSTGTSRVFIAPFRAPAAIGEKDWIPMTDGRFWDLPARWAPGGDVIYFLSNRDGYSCIWAQRLDALTKHASGPPVGLYHAHSASQTMAGFSLARDRIVFNMAERTGNIWMAEWKAQ